MAAALKKQLLRKSNIRTLKNCEEVCFPKLKLSKNIATYARMKITIDPDKC